MTRDDLLALISDRIPPDRLPQLTGHMASWRETDDGEPALAFDAGSVVFTAHGDDLHMVGPIDDSGKVACFVFPPDGDCYLAATADDPLATMAANADMN